MLIAVVGGLGLVALGGWLDRALLGDPPAAALQKEVDELRTQNRQLEIGLYSLEQWGEIDSGVRRGILGKKASEKLELPPRSDSEPSANQGVEDDDPDAVLVDYDRALEDGNGPRMLECLSALASMGIEQMPEVARLWSLLLGMDSR